MENKNSLLVVLGLVAVLVASFFTIGKRNKYSGKRMTGYRRTKLNLQNWRYGWKQTKGMKFRNRLTAVRKGYY